MIPELVVVFICYLMRISRWSDLSVDRVCQEQDVMREADANETSGELGSAFGNRTSWSWGRIMA